jgi:protein O-GlcNAcase/histone acetyltransferase
MYAWTRERQPAARFLFCPTAYCGRMADARLGGDDYLATLGRELEPGIDVFWTGPEIVSREITVAHVRDVQARLRRKPVIWDNLHANDYDGRRFYCGPYAGRPPALRQQLNGVLCNPNSELPLNYVALRTLSEFLRCDDEWDARKAYLAAVQEWLSCFATTGRPIDLEDLVLFCDCYYLPYEDGPEAEALYARAHALLSKDPAEWGDAAAEFRRRAAGLKDLCVRMTELCQRPLFHALCRRVWELREELDLLERYVEARAGAGGADVPFRSDHHQPGTFRGGLVARLQRLLVQHADGSFAPAHPREDTPPDGAGRRRASMR